MSPIPADLDRTVLQRLLARLSEAGLGDMTLDEARRLAARGSVGGPSGASTGGCVGGPAAGAAGGSGTPRW